MATLDNIPNPVTRTPAKIWLMDIEQFIKDHRCLPVTSHSIFESSSVNFHPDGLFSERIFGQIASADERFLRFGYIWLRSQVLQPLMYKDIVQLKRFYEEIMSGMAYARFDVEQSDFVRCERNDPDGGTGYSFFLQYLNKIKFSEGMSAKRSLKIQAVEKYRDRLLMDKMLVLPAGVRDVRIEDGRVSSEEINNIYRQILSLSQALPAQGELLPVYDAIRFNIQRKCNEIYAYIFNILSGKGGYIQKKYTSRNVALSSRNVITSARMVAETPDDPMFLKYNESGTPLFQAAKIFRPFVTYYLQAMFFDPIMTEGSIKTSVIDTKSFNLTYQDIDETEKNKFFTEEGCAAIINNFETVADRDNPVIIRSADGKPHYLWVVYDTGKTVCLFRNLNDFKQFHQDEFNPEYVRPLTYVDMLFIATYMGIVNKHVITTRYPAIEIGSTYPAKVHLYSTMPGRNILLTSAIDPNIQIPLGEYPILGKLYQDSYVPHPARIVRLNADFDGDMTNCDSVTTVEANKEIDEYLQQETSEVTVGGALMGNDKELINSTYISVSTDMVKPAA